MPPHIHYCSIFPDIDVAFEERIDIDTGDACITSGELAQQRRLWPRRTSLFQDIGTSPHVSRRPACHSHEKWVRLPPITSIDIILIDIEMTSGTDVPISCSALRVLAQPHSDR